MHLIGFLIMGAIVGWLAGKIMSGHGYGIIWDIVVGIVGSFLGGFVFSLLFGTQPARLVISFIVALIVLVLLLLLFGGGGLLSSSLQILWIVLLIGVILWALGFVFRGSSGGRWYRW